MVLVKNGHCLLSVNAKGVFTVLQGTNFGLDSSQYKYLLDPLHRNHCFCRCTWQYGNHHH